MISFSGLCDERTSLSGAPTSFRFFGYSREAVEGFQHDIAAIQVIAGPQSVAEVRGATLTPLRASGGDRAWGNVFGPDGTRRPEAIVRRHDEGVVFGLEDEPFPSQPAATRLEAAWYGGVLYNCYGHLVLESLSRLTDDVAASPLPILFHLSGAKAECLEVFRTMLDAFGIGAFRLRLVEDVTAVDRLLIPQAGFVVGEAHHLDHLRSLRQRVRSLLQGTSPASAAPILLSRSALTSRRRVAFGENLIEDALRRSTAIVHPQTLPFVDQVRLVNSATRFLGFIGSQMHNLLFNVDDAPLDVLYLGPRRINRAYFQVDLLAGGTRTYVNAAGHGKAFEFGGASPFLVQFGQLAAALASAGLPAADAALLDHASTDVALMTEDFYRTWTDRFLHMKIIGRSRDWPTDAYDDRLRAVIATYRDRLGPLRDDPAWGPVARDAAADTLRRAGRAVPARATEALLAGLFAPD